MNENFKWIAAAVAVVGAAIATAVYVSQREHKPSQAGTPPVAVAPEPALPEAPAVAHPLPEPDAEQPLPPLDESDVPMRAVLGDLIGRDAVQKYIVPEELVRHIVVTIDNLPNEKVAERVRPVKRVDGEFTAGGTEDAPTLDAANFARYEPMVKLMGSMDTGELVTTYTRYYPLFQQAYESLGHPPQYFNDRVIEVIDHLLAAPELPAPIALQRPNVRYEFADPALESRSAGQKVLIRMGPANAAVVKTKLRELRNALASQSPGG